MLTQEPLRPADGGEFRESKVVEMLPRASTRSQEGNEARRCTLNVVPTTRVTNCGASYPLELSARQYLELCVPALLD